MPSALRWVVIMDRVGGYLDYRALLSDVRAYRDVEIVLAAEAEAHRIQKMRAEQRSRVNRGI